MKTKNLLAVLVLTLLSLISHAEVNEREVLNPKARMGVERVKVSKTVQKPIEETLATFKDTVSDQSENQKFKR